MSSKAKEIYHERQRLQFCLLHSLNNLFQYKDAFTRGDLDIIAGKLNLDDPQKATWTPLSSIFKPHYNALTGNYDVNVLIAALEERGKRVLWHDKRHGASSISLDGPDDKLFGIILNVPVKRYVGLWRSRHWITLRRVDSVWYNLDSDLSAPCPFRNIDEIREFLDSVILNGVQGRELTCSSRSTDTGSLNCSSIALRRVYSEWYNLDSDLSVPCPFQNRDEIREFSDIVMLNEGVGGEAILVMNGEE